MNVNMNQMCESLGPRADVSVGLALFSVGNGLGRIIGGSISEWVHQKQLEPRTMSLFVASLVMMLAHVIFALNFGVEGLYVGITMCGAAFGSTWPLTVVITAELWGSKHHGSNYSAPQPALAPASHALRAGPLACYRCCARFQCCSTDAPVPSPRMYWPRKSHRQCMKPTSKTT